MITKLIDDILLKQQETLKELRKDKKFSLWASDMMTCPRKLKLRQLNYSVIPYSLDTLRSFERGKTIHLWVQELLKSPEAKELQPDIQILNEQWIPTDKGIVGRTDLLLKAGGESYLVELKSVDKNGIKYIQNKDIFETKPKDVLQLVTYYYNAKEKPDHCRLIFMSEDLSWRLEYEINPETYKQAYEKELKHLQGIIASTEIPKPEYCWQCYSKKYGKVFCNYIEHCLEPLGIRLNENKTKAEKIVK